MSAGAFGELRDGYDEVADGMLELGRLLSSEAEAKWQELSSEEKAHLRAVTAQVLRDRALATLGGEDG